MLHTLFPRPSWERFPIWALASLAALLNSPLPLRSAEVTAAPEYQIKAACLFQFAKFVEWPKGTFLDTNAPVLIGVFGKDPFGADLEAVVAKHRVNGRKIVVKRFNNVLEAKSVHIVFVPAGEQEHWMAMSSAIQGLSVLTVGETTQFVEAGGVASLIPVGKVRLTMQITINMDAAERARLAVSSQLQASARIIRPSRAGPNR